MGIAGPSCRRLHPRLNFLRFTLNVFFVKDAEASLAFYTQTLGFSLDWNYQYEGRAWVFEVSLFGFELILNQVHSPTQNREGHGRAFIGLDDDQTSSLLRHIRERGINALRVEWGRPKAADTRAPRFGRERIVLLDSGQRMGELATGPADPL